jgi:NADH-quinone oxidoreductase subunit J
MQALIIAAAVLGGLGVYLLMPGGNEARRAGLGLCGVALALLWLLWYSNFGSGECGAGFVFALLATMTVAGGVMTVTRRSAVSCALWFATVVIGTAGLFLVPNAQFLAASIVIVYAGAIIVMFLFVIMLAQQSGVARYDRTPREPAIAVAASGLMLIVLLWAVVASHRGESAPVRPALGGPGVSQVAILNAEPGAPQVAGLGAALFTEHWLSLEIAGTMLLVAMVGAIVIAARRKPS